MKTSCTLVYPARFVPYILSTSPDDTSKNTPLPDASTPIKSLHGPRSRGQRYRLVLDSTGVTNTTHTILPHHSGTRGTSQSVYHLNSAEWNGRKSFMLRAGTFLSNTGSSSDGTKQNGTVLRLTLNNDKVSVFALYPDRTHWVEISIEGIPFGNSSFFESRVHPQHIGWSGISRDKHTMRCPNRSDEQVGVRLG